MQPGSTIDVVPLEQGAASTAAAILARAFQDDPFAVYMIPDAGQRAACLPVHFAVLLRMGLSWGEVQTTGGASRGVAVWFGPGAWQLAPEQLEEAGVPQLEHELPPGAFARYVAALEHVEALHERDAAAPHWYLCVIGIDRGSQGLGIGSALLRNGLARADEQRLPCYLETAESTNLDFYRRHGFEVVVDEVEPSSGVRFWTLVRPPR